jgi:DNA-binding transcriptional MerR regulator
MEKKKMNEKKSNNFITAKKACEILGVSRQTLHKWTKGGILKGYKGIKRLFYIEDEVRASVIPVTEYYLQKEGIDTNVQNKPVESDKFYVNDVLPLVVEKFCAILRYNTNTLWNQLLSH